ncbi:MAG: hypothetical protein AAGC57_01595 [Pseudomonadota bacterium]
MPTRRAVLAGLASAGLAGTAPAHTPYGQWVVYRQKHLLIGAHRGDPQTYTLAKAVVAALERELPAARARVARGPHPRRIAALMGTGQLLVAVLSAAEAQAMVWAVAPFEADPPVPLVRLAALGGEYGLVAVPDLPPAHAWQVVDALSHAGMAEAPGPGALTVHPGAGAFWRGEPAPD